MSSAEPESVAVNREVWTRSNETWGDAAALATWQQAEITWGNFRVPESELRALPELEGLDVVELGCGVAYFSARLARRGARPTGVDPTPAQLESARRCQRETGIEFPLVEGYGERVPLPDASFDLVLSEYGASISGPTRICGSPRPRASCGPAGNWSSYATARLRSSACRRPGR